jgi:GNAT superfamily N-acetyltransferase
VRTRLSTDANEIIALLRPLIAADPVRLTVLGTVAQVLEEPMAEGWCLAVPGSADIAARSSPVTPVVVVGRWAEPAARGELVTALRRLPDLAAINGPLPWSAEIAVKAVPISHRMDQRLFRLDTLIPPTVVPGSGRRADEGDRPLLLDWYRAFAEEAEARSMDLERSVDRMLASGGAWIWIDAEPMSLAVRRAPVEGSARIGPVYTPPEHRGHGYGSAVTAVATQDVLADGAIPVLFTDLANPTSNAIYQRLGYRPVGDYVSVAVGPPAG